MTVPSLRRRLGLAVMAGVASAWLAALVIGALAIRYELDEIYDSALRVTAHRLAPLVALALTGATPLPAAPSGNTEYVTYLVRSADGRILLQSPEARPGRFEAEPRIGLHGNRLLRFYGVALPTGAILEVADPAHERREALLRALLALLLPILVVVPLSFGLALWLLRRGLTPVFRLRADIARRGGADLSPLVVPDLPAELVPVTEALNGLIDRLRRAMAAERQFTANSAHELRTPLAAALAQTQRLMAEVPAGAARDRGRRIETALHQLIRIVEKLMQLARADGGGLLAGTAADLLPALAAVVDEYQRQEGMAGRLHLDVGEGGLVSRLDPDAFAILIRNLIENALRHGAAAGRVGIEASHRRVSVMNEGPVVPPDLLDGLTARFSRGRSTAPGAGLGLAIADSIAAGSGGRLELRSPAPGQPDGFAAILHLPD